VVSRRRLAVVAELPECNSHRGIPGTISGVSADQTRRPAGDDPAPQVIDRFDEEYVAVFIPTTPSPVNGFYFFVRKADTIALDMTVDVALRSIISMGVAADSEAVKHRVHTPDL